MIFERKIESEILDWFNDGKKTSALLIEGARRIGKTTVCQQFAEKYFKRSLLIDFSKVGDDILRLFDAKEPLDDFFRKLFLYMESPVLPRGSLIIFDEIQHCIKAREKIKALVEDGRYYYIETGSLISIRENSTSIQIPSNEFPIEMHPMDYEEFLWALGRKEEADYIRNLFAKRESIDQATHNRLMEPFRYYAMVGGMPSVVSAFTETSDFHLVERRKKEILALYENDLRKIDAKYKTATNRIFDSLSLIASKQTFSMPLGIFGIDPRTDAFTNNLEKIEESKIFQLIYKTNSIEASLRGGVDKTSFKLFYGDIGLGISHSYGVELADARSFYKKLSLGEIRSNFGYLYEGLVGQMLAACGKKLYYASWSETETKKDGTGYPAYYEVDFLYLKYGKTQPVEAKSGGWRTTTSLDKLAEKHPGYLRKPIVVSDRPFQDNEKRTELPPYMVFCL